MSSTAKTTFSGNTQLTVYKWLTLVTALAMLVQAVLGSQGSFYGGHRGLLTGHAQVGNTFFLLVVIQAYLSFQLSSGRHFPRWILGLNILLILLTVAQIGLGYSSRDNISLAAWHIPNGVLLMGTCTLLAVLAWFRTTTASPVATNPR
ncbi:MAG: hypothetical protein ACR2OU_00320 [Thermomicrobiales bacterium]